MKMIRLKVARKYCFALPLAVFSFAGMCAKAQATPPVKSGNKHATTTSASAKTVAATGAQDPGERKFQANCSRCHTAPEEISPRIAGTVVRHMRVRASLSAEDERDILRYLAP